LSKFRLIPEKTEECRFENVSPRRVFTQTSSKLSLAEYIKIGSWCISVLLRPTSGEFVRKFHMLFTKTGEKSVISPLPHLYHSAGVKLDFDSGKTACQAFFMKI
jgi:hypothetical protein